MERSRKHKGFMKVKLLRSFFRAVKPVTSSSDQLNSEAKPIPSSTSVENFSTTPAPKQRVSFMKPDSITVRDPINGRINSIYSGDQGDENVDIKAESYISCVQERFRNEQDTDWRISYEDKNVSVSHSLTTRMALVCPLVEAHYS